MISQHQPHIFTDLPLNAAASSLADGTMKLGLDEDKTQVLTNRAQWLEAAGTSVDRATLLSVAYGDGVRYDRVLDVDENFAGKGMFGGDNIAAADALFTKTSGQALFLPIADCAGVVLFDVRQHVLGLLHLGRQATFDGLAEKAIEHMAQTYGTDPKDIFVWISPSITGESYWLQHFDFAGNEAWQPHIHAKNGGYFVDLQGYNYEHFIKAGVPKNQIERSLVNTATDSDYPSHYAFKTLDRPEKSGRFAVVAFMP